MLIDDTLIEYADPEIYDLENSDFEPDGSFFLKFARKINGSVLELGCGTGRVTIPMAQNHIEITGLDVVPVMIQRAKEKAGDLPINWVIDDIRHFQLNRSYGLIFETGSVFQHLLTRKDQEDFLCCVRGHLDGEGRFIVSLMFPHPKMLKSVKTEKDWFQYKNHAGIEIRVSGTEYYDSIRQVKLETAYRRWVDENGKDILKVAPLALRYMFPQEMESLLHYNGFKVVEQFGDWDSGQLTNTSRMIIFVCQKK